MVFKRSLLSALLCLTIINARAGWAQQVQPLEPEWLRQMYAEGWQKAQEGVLQRKSIEGELETFSYGVEGLQWAVQHYQQRSASLQSQYDASPSEDLAELIDQYEDQILRLEENIDSAPSAESFNGEALEACTPLIGGEAFAGSQTVTRGVTANVNVYFHSDCGDLASTFTMAYAHAATAAGETTVTHSDPKNNGSWLDSYSSASVNGSTACNSWAEGQVFVSGELVYRTYMENTKCDPIDNVSTYSLDSPSWTQAGTGHIGALTLNNASGMTLIGSNYVPIVNSGLPQAGISFAKSTVSKLESQPVDSVSAFANAPVIKVEFRGRLREVPAATTVVIGMGHWISGVGSYGLRIATDQLQRLIVVSLNGTNSFTVHNGGITLGLNEVTNDSYRWVWTENAPGSSMGTAQWWRKVSGAWQPWGMSKSDMPRPVGHASTRFRLHAHENGSPQAVGFDFLETSITFGSR